jgi:hypothetical protein
MIEKDKLHFKKGRKMREHKLKTDVVRNEKVESKDVNEELIVEEDINKKKRRKRKRIEIKNIIVSPEVSGEVENCGIETERKNIVNLRHSERIPQKKNYSDYILDINEESGNDDELGELEEDNLVLLEKDHDADKDSLQKFSIIGKSKNAHSASSSRGTVSISYNVTDFITIPTEEQCNHIYKQVIPGCNFKVGNLFFSYFGSLIELIFKGKGTKFYHKMENCDSFKKKILEMLLLFPWKDFLKEAVVSLLKEMFCLSDDEISKAKGCLEKWLSDNDEGVLFKDNLTEGTLQYWKLLENDSSGWKWLSRISLMFCSTMASESSVERDFSKARNLIGDHRFNNSNELIEAELIL